MDVVVRPIGDVTLLDISGKMLGGPESDPLRTELDRILQGKSPKVLVNLSRVPWMNSAGLGILLAGYSRVRDMGGRMVFTGIQERVREILETTKLVTVLETFADERSGTLALQASGTVEGQVMPSPRFEANPPR